MSKLLKVYAVTAEDYYGDSGDLRLFLKLNDAKEYAKKSPFPCTVRVRTLHDCLGDSLIAIVQKWRNTLDTPPGKNSVWVPPNIDFDEGEPNQIQVD